MKNVFYFKKICGIGGTEQFLYEIAKAYSKDFDITVMYDEASEQQLKRLRKLVRCKRHIKGHKVECEKAFFNFNIDAIDDIEAKEYIFVSHAIYQELGYKPPIDHPKLTRFIGVSQYSVDKIKEYADILGLNIKPELCYNPLMLEPVDKVLHLLSAARLSDETKGGKRTKQFIKAMDEYCLKNNRHYTFDIYTNGMCDPVESSNVNIKQARIDIRPFIADCDVVVTLSNNMETYCYTNVEKISYGGRLLTTPLAVNKELNFPKDAVYVVDWDLKNVNEVIEKMFKDLDEGYKKYEYKSPKSTWNKLLAVGKPTYEEDFKKKYKVRALPAFENFIDKELHKKHFNGEEWEVSFERLEELLNHPTKLIEEIEE